MVARTVTEIRTGPENYVGTDFLCTVRGTDNAVRVFSVRYVVRIMSYGFFGTVRVRIFYRTDTDFSNRYVFWYRFSKVLLSLPNYFRRHHGCPYHFIRTTYRTKKKPYRIIRTTYRIEEIRTFLSVPRTVHRKTVPTYFSGPVRISVTVRAIMVLDVVLHFIITV